MTKTGRMRDRVVPLCNDDGEERPTGTGTRKIHLTLKLRNSEGIRDHKDR